MWIISALQKGRKETTETPACKVLYIGTYRNNVGNDAWYQRKELKLTRLLWLYGSQNYITLNNCDWIGHSYIFSLWKCCCLHLRGFVSVPFVKSLLTVLLLYVSSKPKVSWASSYLMFQRIRSVKKILNYLVKGKMGLWQFNKVSKDFESKQLALMLSITELLTPGHQRINQLLFSQEKHRLRFGLFGFFFKKGICGLLLALAKLHK